jgi:regulator of sirC expression with transglutaminase-like and TPR domain
VTESPSRRQFTEVVAHPDGDLDLALASLLIACEEHPDLDVPGYLALLDAMGDEARVRLGGEPTAEEAACVLNGYLFDELGFQGNVEDYYDPRNSFLNEVLDRRAGIPVTLCTVYMEVGARAGVEVDGIGLPGHFIARVRAGQGQVLVDPFHRGAKLTPADCQQRLDRIFRGRLKLEAPMLASCGRKAILARTLQNLEAIYVKAGDRLRALGILDLLFRVRPPSAQDLKDRGLLYADLDCHDLAACDLEQFLARAPGSPETSAIRVRVGELRRRAALLN